MVTKSTAAISRLDRVRALFTRVKVPGWLCLLYLAFQGIPDWKGRLDFWLSFAQSMGGYASPIATILLWPYFNLVLAATGIAWLLLVGEPTKGVQRHPWIKYLSEAFAAICFVALLLTAGYGYFQMRVSEASKALQQMEVSRSGPAFWRLTDASKAKLIDALDKTPVENRFLINAQCLPDAISRTYMVELGKIFLDHRWQFSLNCFVNDLRPDLLGLYIDINKEYQGPNELPADIKKLAEILEAADIPFVFAQDDLREDEWYLNGGNGPSPDVQAPK